jgi:hypothetical protein
MVAIVAFTYLILKRVSILTFSPLAVIKEETDMENNA